MSETKINNVVNWDYKQTPVWEDSYYAKKVKLCL
jgi:hypothetical protein